jgi:predicted transposase/invertase (TIGR01784 family)
MTIQIDPKVDYAFKHVFGREESKPALISLLDAVLQPAAGQHIASLDLLNPFNDKDTPDGKTTILDIKARDETGRQFNVEMQMLAFGAFRQRALYYWAKLHQGQLKKGKDFRILRPTIAVCFVDTPLFPDIADYHLTFELRERRHQTLFTDQMAVHILELTKFHKGVEDLATPLDRWLYFLRHAVALDLASLPASLDVPEVRWALGDLRMISQSERERERYESHLKLQRDIYTALAEREEAGLEKGRTQERAERFRDDIRYLQELLGRGVTSSDELRAMPLPELENLVAGLRAELKARLANGS